MLTPVSVPRQPQHDSLAPSDPVWVDIPLGVGQVPGLQGEGDFQFSPDLSAVHREDIRRTPERDHAYVVHKPPNAPA